MHIKLTWRIQGTENQRFWPLRIYNLKQTIKIDTKKIDTDRNRYRIIQTVEKTLAY